jgi:Right handed beta helix region
MARAVPGHGPSSPARAAVALAALAVTLLIACGGAVVPLARAQATSGFVAGPLSRLAAVPPAGQATPTSGRVIRVPADYLTIQAGVDAARAGDLILVASGIYHEAVVVRTPNLTIRGEDRTGAVLDGQSQLGNAFLVMANNIVIENLTAHHYLANGFYWSKVSGYRGSYLTAYDNGAYGFYAYGSAGGQFDHDYASGHPSAGLYIGQCFPCDALITHVRSTLNGLGYSGTNAGGNLVIVDSEWDDNGAGLVPNSLDAEEHPPERGATIIDNYVHDNGTARAPFSRGTHPGLPAGISVPGGDFNDVERNRVIDNYEYGILVIGITDKQLWLPSGNMVAHNVVTGSTDADLALALPAGAANCFADNQATTTLPPLLELTHPCGSPLTLAGGGDLSVTLRLLEHYAITRGPGPGRRSPDYRALPAPPAQPGMPEPAAPPGPLFTERFPSGTITPGGLPPAITQGGTAMLAPFGFSAYWIVQSLLTVYGDLILFALYAAWLSVGFVELGQRGDLTGRARLGWGALLVAVPVIGPLLYYFGGGSQLSRGFTLGLVVGAPAVVLLLTTLLLIIASFTL